MSEEKEKQVIFKREDKTPEYIRRTLEKSLTREEDEQIRRKCRNLSLLFGIKCDYEKMRDKIIAKRKK